MSHTRILVKNSTPRKKAMEWNESFATCQGIILLIQEYSCQQVNQKHKPKQGWKAGDLYG